MGRALRRHIRGLHEYRAEIHRPKCPEEQQNSNRKSKVANSRGDERFLPRINRRLLQKPESDQQIAAQPDAFPTHKHQHNVGGQHQRQHEEDKQIQVSEEAVISFLVRHVAGRINVHEQAYERHHQQHYDRQMVHLQREIHLERARRHPVEIILEKRNLPRGQQREFANRFQHRQKRQRNRSNPHGIYNRLGPILAQQAVQRSPCQRQRENDPKMFEYWHQNFRRFTRSMFSVCRF